MLSRLNLLVTVAILFVVSVSGTGVSLAGQAVGTPQTNLVFTPPRIGQTAAPGEVDVGPGQGEFRYSLCEGRILAAGEVSRRCTRDNVGRTMVRGGTNLGPIVRGGNQASYVFAVPPGQNLPDGVSIDGFGVLHVREDARLARTVIRVCVRQLNVNDSCRNIGLNRQPPLDVAGNAAAPLPAEEVGSPSPANVIVPLAIAGGGGIAGYYLLNQYLPSFGGSSSCTPANPLPGAVCFGGQGNSPACLAAIAQQDTFCQCSGFSGFDVATGGCQ